MGRKTKHKLNKHGKPNRQGEGGGAPDRYREEYCEKLVQHMAEGGSFESFGAEVGVCRFTLYNWAERYPKFFDAKHLGESKALKFYEDAGKAIMTGSLRRVGEESVVRDKKGEIVVGPDGKPLVDRKFSSVRGDSRVWGLTMRNRFRWKERVEVTTKGFKDYSEMTDQELDEEIERLEELEEES